MNGPLARTQHIISAFAGNDIVEAIFNRVKKETALLCSDGQTVRAETRVDLGGSVEGVPYSPFNNLLTHGVVLLPSAAHAFDSADTLFRDVCEFIHRYADLSEGFESVAASYVMLTWVYDAFHEVPYLRFLGDLGVGKSRVLQTIGSVCYKPMFASGASTVSPLFRMIDIIRGTLVIDEADFRFSDERAEITKILNNGNAVGFPVLRADVTPTKEFNPRAFVVFGPKIIATRASFEDRALESRCITEVMRGLPPRADIPLSLPRTFGAEAEALRNQLLMYRFVRLRETRTIEPPRIDGVEPRISQVYGPLLAVAPVEARDFVLACAHRSNAALTSERGGSIEASLVGILEELRSEGVQLSVKRITERFVTQFGDDFHRTPTPRWIGAQLRRRLAMNTVKAHGNFVIADEDVGRIAQLAKRYGVARSCNDAGMLGTF